MTLTNVYLYFFLEFFTEIMNTKPTCYDRKSCCWNCRRQGHTSKECTERKQLFCSFCLREGVTTRDCKCRSRRGVHKNRPYRRNSQAGTLPSNEPAQPARTLAIQNILAEQSSASRNTPQPGSVGTTVGGNLYKTFINTQMSYSVVGWKVANQASMIYQTTREYVHRSGELVSEQIIPIGHGTQLKHIRCRIVTNPDDCITLGEDAILRFGCKIELGGLTVLNLQGDSLQSKRKIRSLPRTRVETAVRETPKLDKMSPNISHTKPKLTPEVQSITISPPQNPENIVPPKPNPSTLNNSTTEPTAAKLGVPCNSASIRVPQDREPANTSLEETEESVVDAQTNEWIEEGIAVTNNWEENEFLAALKLNDDEVDAILDDKEPIAMDTNDSTE